MYVICSLTLVLAVCFSVSSGKGKKNEQVGWHQTKCFAEQREASAKWKDNQMNEKIFVNHISNKKLKPKIWGFPSDSVVTNLQDAGWIPGLWRCPGEGKLQPTPVFLPEKSHGLRILAGYSPWGRKESDTTEQLHFTSPQPYWIRDWGVPETCVF